MLVSIIIVNYNTFRITCDCIRSIYKYTSAVDYEIILVDNASTKDNADDFLKEFPDIRLIKSKENGGFAKGNNLGINQAKGDVILLLNSDTILTEDSISIVAGQFRNRGNIIASAKLVYEDCAYQRNARKFRSIRNELLDICRPFLKLLSYKRRAQLMLNQYFKGDFDTACDWVSGAFMMIPATAIAKMKDSKLDERFFMYGEDQLWCYQFQQLGYKAYFIATTSVIHIENASTDITKQLKLRRTLISRELEIMRYRKGKRIYYYIFLLIFCTKEFARLYIKIIAYQLFNRSIK